MEWLWRGMTYGKFPSMHKDQTLPPIEVPPLEAPALLSPPIALAAADGTQTATASSEIMK
jgi:hypothetical protein